MIPSSWASVINAANARVFALEFGGHAPQVVVHQRHEAVQRIGPPGAMGDQQLGDFGVHVRPG